MNENIIKLFEQIIINNGDFDNIKEVALSMGSSIPPYNSLDLDLFLKLDKFSKKIEQGLERSLPVVGSRPFDNEADVEEAKRNEDTIFQKDIVGKYILLYHIYTNDQDKTKAIEYVKNLLVSLKEFYEYIEEDPRYFDDEFNFKWGNMGYNLVERAKKRLEELEQSLNITIPAPQRRVRKILNDHGLL